MIPDDQIEEVRARADIVSVIGEYVPLKKAGKDFKGLCPFHEERTASFYVVPDKGFYKCFGCGESGDVFTFLSKQKGFGFLDAVRHVAARSGVELREVKGRNPAEEDPLRPLREAVAFARDFFLAQLRDEEVGRRARSYLADRGIAPDVVERFSIGYAPAGGRALRDAAGVHGITDELLLEVGLVKPGREEGREPYDAFRDRLIFPIESASGAVTAFGGRTLPGAPPGAPKYLNSPESSIYHKGGVLYGLSRARNAIRREGAAWIVEGYMDVVALAAAGIEHAVAPLGTSLTEEQAALIARYANRAILLFDSDAAGARAAFRAGDLLLAARVHPFVATLPEGEDPDTLVRDQGVAALRGFVADAVDILDRKLQVLEERDYFSTIDGTRQALDRLNPTIRATADPSLRDIYVARVAERTGVRRETIEEEIGRHEGGLARRDTDTTRSPRRSARGAVPPAIRRTVTVRGAERVLLLLMIKDRRWLARAAERITPAVFADSAFRTIYRALLEDPELDSVPESMDPQAALRLEGLFSDPEELSHAGRVFEAAVERLLDAPVDEEARELDRRIDEASDEDESLRLLQEKARLRAEQRERHHPDWSSSQKARMRMTESDRHDVGS